MTKIFINYQTFLELRIWLKIGIAQEKKGSYDAANLAYQEAIQITEDFFDLAESEAANKKGTLAFHLENLNYFKLLFQPHLCQAYLLEKSAQNVHTSFELVDSFLGRLKKLLKFDTLQRQANFPLFCADCLTKAADLFYYKGFTPYHAQRPQINGNEMQFINRAENLYFKAIQLLLQTYFSNNSIEFTNNPCSQLLENLMEFFCFATVQPTNKSGIAPSVQVFQLLASAVSDLSNVLLTKLGAKEPQVKISTLFTFLLNWRSLQYGERDALKALILIFKISDHWLSLGLNMMAARIFLWASMHKEAAFEYEKMIQTLRYCNIDFPAATHSEINGILALLKKELYTPGIQH